MKSRVEDLGRSLYSGAFEGPVFYKGAGLAILLTRKGALI